MKKVESKWAGADGVTFQIQGWEPDNGNPKAVVALIHGLGEHVARYAHVAQALTEAGYALIGFDLRGHGTSGGARGHFPSLEAVMQDIRAFFRFLVTRYPELPHFIYGHSLGGLLTLAYATQYSNGLKGVMVTGSALRSPLQEDKLRVTMAKVLGVIAPTMTIPSGLETAAISRDAEVVRVYTSDPLVHDKTSLGLGKSAINAVEMCFARAADFVPPLLIMHGKADRITYPSGSEEFARLACQKNQDVTVKLWNDMYHEIHNEPEKAEVFQYMIAWLDKHLK